MTEQVMTACRKKQCVKIVANTLGFGVPVLAVIAACCICFFSKRPIVIENPTILVFASLFVLFPVKKEPSVYLIQRIITFYLIGIVINELSPQHLQIPFLPIGISASYSTIVMSLFAIGYLVSSAKPTNGSQNVKEKTDALYGWLLAIAIITIHMAFLALLLNKFYGYGYDHDLSVLGNICLYFLLFIFLWDKLENIRFRQVISSILAVLFLAITTTVR